MQLALPSARKLDRLKITLSAVLKKVRPTRIIVKPNLVCDQPWPTTTDAKLVEQIVKICKKHGKTTIAEGSGYWTVSTKVIFDKLGYTDLANRYNIELVDLNLAPTTQFTRKDKPFLAFERIDFPSLLSDSFVISLANLKKHSMSTVTLSLKNMLGCLPNKAEMHAAGRNIHHVIHDVLLCKFPDFAIIDARVGLDDWNGKPICKPNVILFGDAVDIDKKGCKLLSIDWKRIEHIRLAEKLAR